MNHIEQVASRLKGLRDALEITTQEIADSLGIEKKVYESYESGKTDIPVSFLHHLAHQYGVELTALLFGEEPKMKSYFVTRKGKGESVERTKAYQYQSLAAGFANRIMDPFLVRVDPSENRKALNSHKGQEFNYVVEGRMEFTIGGNIIILEAGDSIMFDAIRPHGMRALDEKPVFFLAIIS